MILSRRTLLVATGLSLPAGALALGGCDRQPERRAPEPQALRELPRERARAISRVLPLQPTKDGAGVALSRAIGTGLLPMVDPFLMLDQFRSDDPNDYLAGFPSHPHRGFETVTYMLDGAMEHKDSVGNTGRLRPGSAQWMTAGSGIIHSEMPKQERGRMWGFQLWVNLPRTRKMIAPRYQDIDPSVIPELDHEGAHVRVVAGQVFGATGPVAGIDVDPTFLDVSLQPGASMQHALNPAHNAFALVIEGAVRIGPNAREVREGHVAVFGAGEYALAQGTEAGGRMLLIAGQPLREPIARRGPFVMNTQEELRQAFTDYQNGTLVRT